MQGMLFSHLLIALVPSLVVSPFTLCEWPVCVCCCLVIEHSVPRKRVYVSRGNPPTDFL